MILNSHPLPEPLDFGPPIMLNQSVPMPPVTLYPSPIMPSKTQSMEPLCVFSISTAEDKPQSPYLPMDLPVDPYEDSDIGRVSFYFLQELRLSYLRMISRILTMFRTPYWAKVIQELPFDHPSHQYFFFEENLLNSWTSTENLHIDVDEEHHNPLLTREERDFLYHAQIVFKRDKPTNPPSDPAPKLPPAKLTMAAYDCIVPGKLHFDMEQGICTSFQFCLRCIVDLFSSPSWKEFICDLPINDPSFHYFAFHCKLFSSPWKKDSCKSLDTCPLTTYPIITRAPGRSPYLLEEEEQFLFHASKIFYHCKESYLAHAMEEILEKRHTDCSHLSFNFSKTANLVHHIFDKASSLLSETPTREGTSLILPPLIDTLVFTQPTTDPESQIIYPYFLVPYLLPKKPLQEKFTDPYEDTEIGRLYLNLLLGIRAAYVFGIRRLIYLFKLPYWDRFIENLPSTLPSKYYFLDINSFPNFWTPSSKFLIDTQVQHNPLLTKEEVEFFQHSREILAIKGLMDLATCLDYILQLRFQDLSSISAIFSADHIESYFYFEWAADIAWKARNFRL
jgi:hypothetical protein